MSDKTPNQPAATPTSTDTESNAGVTLVEKRPNVLVRGYRKIRSTPPKTAIAVGLGVGLVTAGAVLGRKTAPLHVEIVSDDFEPEPVFVTPDSEESNDTTA